VRARSRSRALDLDQFAMCYRPGRVAFPEE
jgi:hypothetical protein